MKWLKKLIVKYIINNSDQLIDIALMYLVTPTNIKKVLKKLVDAIEKIVDRTATKVDDKVLQKLKDTINAI